MSEPRSTSPNDVKGVPAELIPALLRKIEAEATSAESRSAYDSALLRSAQIDLAKKEDVWSRELASDYYHRVYYFDGQVDSKSVGFCIDQLDTWDRTQPESNIEIVFTSPGGSVIDGLALFDHIQYLKRKGHTITTVCLGVAASMAGILLQSGTTRIMTKESWLLIHQISAGVMGSFGEIEDRVDWINRTQERVIDIFASRASAVTGEDYNKTRRYIKKNWERTDWWIDSDEALKLGFIDEVR